MIYPKIPDEIYENRCRYCWHFCKDGENRDFDVKEEYSYSTKLPCKIHSIAGYFHQERVQDGTPRGYYKNIPYTDGECRGFTPHLSYPGICQSCEYHNEFVDGYCNGEKGDDYRLAFLANAHGSEQYGSKFYTCSKWKMSSRLKDYYLEDIVYGRVPPIVVVKTFKLVSPLKLCEVAQAWAEIREKRLAEIEAERKQKEEPKKQATEQLYLDLGM